MRSAVLLAIGFAAIPAWAELPPGEWQTARPIALPDLPAPGRVYLPLDDDALAGVESLSEYRIARAGRAEVPYRMVVEAGRTETLSLPAAVVSQATDRTKHPSLIQLTLDLGEQSRLANRVHLKLTGDNFRCRVQVEGAHEESKPWLVLGEGLVYRHEGKYEQMVVAIPPHEHRLLRLTMTVVQGQVEELAGFEVSSEVTTPRALVPVSAALSRREDRKARQTVLDLDLGKLCWDLGEARFEVKEASFDRPVTIAVDAGGTGGSEESGYEAAGGGRLKRVVGGKPVILPLEIRRARRLRIVIYNGDDRPLTIDGVRVWRVRRGLVFSADPAERYELWYGRAGAPAPVYDIQRLPLSTPPAELPQATLGKARAMPLKPPPPAAWSEQHPAVLWAALTAVLVLLTIVIVRAMRSVKLAPPSS